MAEKHESIAEKVHIWDCGPRAVESLSKRDLAALHIYKRDFVDSLEKLYKAWGDAKAADDFIRPILHKL
jgi:hypothetical protein